MSSHRRPVMLAVWVGVLSWALSPCYAFVSQARHRDLKGRLDDTKLWADQGTGTQDVDSLEVVLFGVGDLRADDHEGLRKSLERASKFESSRVLPLIVLDQETVANIPGAVAHTDDTARLIAEAISDLRTTLEKMNLPLHVDIGSKTTMAGLSKVLDAYIGSTDIQLHVCDLGVVDNSMKYSPCGALQREELPSGCKLLSWPCELRSAPWEDLEVLPESYGDYTKKFTFEPIKPVATQPTRKALAATNEAYIKCPTAEDVTNFMHQSLGLNPAKCKMEQNSGLYRSHWGGLSADTVGESKVREMLRIYVDQCGEDDEAFANIPMVCTRNDKSLEHATILWNLRGDGTKTAPETKNLIAGELMTRYLLAPLLLGTLSPRRLWWSIKKASTPVFTSPLRTLVETQEWHKAFAAKQMVATSTPGMTYKYWRWHGFLCRYGEQIVAPGTAANKQGILFIHGFGASANQWQRTVSSLEAAYQTNPIDDDDVTVECLAPDLIGFGQSEKPPITYSGFTWESYTGDFIKEIACSKNGWQSFVMGGNSIGGFVSMCAAANDATTSPEAISGCGAPGSGRCAGTILMNAAGVIQSKEDVMAIEASVLDKSQLKSVAQITAADELAPCKPIPRLVARAVGNALLSYLRPRIQSICVNLYPINPGAVDDELCRNILRDSLDPGAINVMISGSKLPMPRTYNEVAAADFGQSSSATPAESQFKGPILVAQGVLDPLNDALGRARSLKALRHGIQVAELQGGHCPHDEIPDDVAGAIVSWMKDTKTERQSMTERALQVQP